MPKSKTIPPSEDVPGVHVEKPVTDSKVESRPAGAGDNGDSRETGGNPSKPMVDPALGTKPTGP